MLELSGPRKRKRGERGPNKLKGGIYHITDISEGGIPEGPKEAVHQYWITIGFLVREHVTITNTDWQLLDKATKNKLWDLLSARIKFPKCTEKVVEKVTMVSMSIKFRSWKVEMNNYVKNKKSTAS